MFSKIVKKAHQKMVTSFSGILSILVLLLPIALIVVGIIMFINDTTSTNSYLWIAMGVVCILFSYKRFKEFVGLFKYIFKPEEYETIKNMKADGHIIEDYDSELEEADVLNKLNKDNPIMFTEHFVIGYTGYTFFMLYKNDIIWAYEYNGNGIVFFDKHKSYGFTFFQHVDDNDKIMEQLKHDMPYIYLGIDFDYKTIMHDDFDNTVVLVENERNKFEADPDKYRVEKEESEKARLEEEARVLEEEKNAELAKIQEQANETIDKVDNEEEK